MKLSTRAVLLSLFMFPGAGHILLKKKISGCLFIGVGVVATFIIVTSKMKRAYVIADQLSKGEIPFDMQHIIEKVIKILTTAPSGSEGDVFIIAFNALIIVWFVSTLDAYRIGRKMDKES